MSWKADLVVLAAYVLAANPAITGLPFHEWVSLGAFVVLAAHVAMRVERVQAYVRALVLRHDVKALATLALATALLITLCVAMVSGIMVSRFVLPALGLYAQGYFVWKPVHVLSAKLLLALVVVHVAVHARDIARKAYKG